MPIFVLSGRIFLYLQGGMNVRKLTGTISALLFFCLTLTGCANKGDYSEESYNIMASYIANSIIKYDENQEYKLEYIKAPDESVTIEEETTDNSQKESEEITKEDETSENNKEEESEVEVKEENNSNSESNELAKVIGLSEVTVDYKGYVVVDNYTDGEYFVIEPQQGNKLCIVTYNMLNITDQDINVSLTPDNISYVLYNENKEYKAAYTLLMNDLHYFEGTLKVKESKEVVLVFEIAEDDVDKDMNLEVKSDNGVYSAVLE